MRHSFSKLIAVLCLWMGTGGVLHHTEDLAGLASLAAPVAFGHVTPATPPDDCAACEWTQGLQTGPPITFQVALPRDLLSPFVRRVPASLLLPALHQRSPRGPPSFLS